jgi:hypothetical protein
MTDNDYGILLFTVSAFKTEKKKQIRELLNEFKFDIKLESVSAILCSVY